MDVITSFLFASLCCSANAFATIYPNPDPTIYGNDIDGTGYFIPSGGSIALEFFDLTEQTVAVGSTFGFYFQSDPLAPITIFDSTDLVGDTAIIDYINGVVYDFDDGNTVQSLFTPATENIGFFISLDNSFGFPSLYTDPLLNNDYDVAGVFPILGSSESYAFTFMLPDVTAPLQATPLVGEIVTGINPVPEPSTIILLGSGLLGVLGLKRKREKTL